MSNIKEMVDWIKEERESSKQEVLQEVLEWLEVHFSNVHVLHDDRLEGNFGSKEDMLQSFKERFKLNNLK